MAKLYRWKLKQREVLLGEKTLIMGILNVTPDSFSDGGKYDDPDRAFARALELEELGADMIDIGAESTRPGSTRIGEAEELRRLIPVLKRLKGHLQIPISVDTYKSGVAEKALEHGAEIINDPSGIAWDPLLPKVAAKWDAGLVVNHMRGTPDTWSKMAPIKNVIQSVGADLEAASHRAQRQGVLKSRIVIDPGLGFGKRREQNAEIIAELGKLGGLDLPILLGPSRKLFLKQESEEGTEWATAAAVAVSIQHGAHIVRVHDVKAMRIVADVVDNILANAAREPGEAEEELPRRRSQENAPFRSIGGGMAPPRRYAGPSKGTGPISVPISAPKQVAEVKPPVEEVKTIAAAAGAEAPEPVGLVAPSTETLAAEPAPARRSAWQGGGGPPRRTAPRPYGDRPPEDRSSGDRSSGDRSYGDRPRQDRASGPFSPRHGGDRPRPYGDRRPGGDRPSFGDRQGPRTGSPGRFGGGRPSTGGRPNSSGPGGTSRGGADRRSSSTPPRSAWRSPALSDGGKPTGPKAPKRDPEENE